MSTPYEEIVKTLATGKQKSPYADTIQGLVTEARQRQALADSGNQAVKGAPDRAAEIDTLSKFTGMPTDLIDRNFDVIKERAKIQATPYGDILRDSPQLAEWLKLPQNAGMVQDDLAHMGYLDWTLTKLGDYSGALASGFLGGLGSAIRGSGEISDALDRRLVDFFDTDAAMRRWFPVADPTGRTRLPGYPLDYPGQPEAKRPSETFKAPWWALSSLQKTAGSALEKAGKYFAPPEERQGFGTQVVEGLGQFAPLIAAEMFGGPELATGMLVGQGAAGMTDAIAKDAGVPNLGTPKGLVDKGTISNLFERPLLKNPDGTVSTTSSFSIEEDGKEVLLPSVIDGKRLTQEEAIAHYKQTGEHLGKFATAAEADAYAQDLHNAQAHYLQQQETPQYKKDLAMLAGAGIAVGTGKIGLDLLLKRVPFPIKNAVVSKLVDILAAGGIQATQAATQTLLNDVTRHVLTNPDAKIGEGLGQQMAVQGVTGGIARLLLTAALGENLQSHFKQRQESLAEVTKAVTGSKLAQRSPDALRDFIAQHASETPGENILIPSDKFKEYFQSKGVDPAQVADEMMHNGADAYRESIVTGADLRVPFADYETKLAPEHGRFFDEELRFHPGDMNFREAQEFLASEGEKLNVDEKQAKPDEAVQAAGEKIKQDIVGQLHGYYDPVAADSNAEAVASVFKTLGQRMGVDPFELYSKYNLGVNFPLPDILKSKTAGGADMVDSMIERLRSGDVPTGGDLYGKSLVEFLRDAGGVQDYGGEITKMQPDVATDKKSVRFLKKNPLVAENGLVLHNAVEKAVEEGYLPEGSDESNLIDAIDSELRGDPIYSQFKLDNPESERAAALHQLDHYIRERGFDLKAMSNEQVRAALDEAATHVGTPEGDGVEFYQRMMNAPTFYSQLQRAVETKLPETTTLGEGFALFQGDQNNKRGSLVFNKDGSFNINLFAKRNLSTFIHETGHFYLEVFGDLVDQLKAQDPATLTDTQRTMMADYEKALKWLGVDGRAGIGEDQHEQWARGLEAYVREGKAPSVELRSVFARFRSWLIDLYRSVRSLKVEMNPEIREVMDRLFATDQEIERAQHEAEIKSVFMTQEESGLDNEGWQAHQTKLQRASDEAKNALQAKLMQEFASRRQEWWISEESKLRGEIEQQVYRQPEYVALSALRKGELPDGSESPIKVKLDLNLIKERYGKNTTATDALRRLGVARLEDGVDPDTVARQFGFQSGDALVEAITNARPMRELIEAEVQDEMIRRHGDMRLDGSIHDEAQAAVLGKYRDEVVREEMRTLRKLLDAGRPAQEAEARRQMKEREYERRWLEAENRLKVAIAEGRKQAEIDSLRAESAKIKADQKADAAGFVVALRKGQGIPTPEQLGRFAEDRISKAVISDVVPGRYWAAARNASRQATALAATKDYAGALAAKGRELLNLELFRQATALKESFEKTRTAWLKMFRPDSKIATRRSMEYVNAARAIASKLLFPEKQARVLESLKTLEKYDPEAYEDVQDAIASIVEDPRKLRELRVEEFNGIRDVVASLWNRARADNQIVVDGKKVERQAAQDQLVEKLQARSQRAGTLGKNSTISDMEKAGVHGLTIGAALRRVESWVEAMDGGKDGPWRDYIWNPVKESINNYRLQKVDVLTKYAEILKPIEKTLTRAEIAAPEINYVFKGGKAELLGAMLHTGNRESPMSNLSKLLRGRRDVNGIPWGSTREDGSLDTSKWDAMVKRMQDRGILAKADYDYLQGVWNLFESLKPGLQRSHFETKGFYFKEVPADAIETLWGTYRGGYVPAKADPFMSTAAAIRSDKQAMSEAGNSYALPSAGLGNTKTRLAVAEPLSMNLAFIPGHIDWALRLTHIDPRVKDVSKMIFDRSFRASVDAHNPAAIKDMLVPWLQRAATQRIEEVGKYKAIDSFARLLRTGSGIQTVSFSVTNGLQQGTGLFLTATKVPAGKLLSSLFDYVGHPTKFSDSIMDKSAFMRTFETNRAMEIQQDINNIVTNPNTFAKAQNFTRKHGQVLAGMTQSMVNLVSWRGAYDNAIEQGRTEKQAVRDADSVIRSTQGSFFPEDISRAETGTPFVRALTMFSSYFNMQANLMMTEVGNTIRSDRGAMYKAGRLVSVYALGFMLPSVAVQAIQNTLTGNWKEEDDDYMMGALKLFFGAQLRDAAMMVPGAGGVVQAGINSVLTKSTYDDDIRTTPWLQIHAKAGKDFGVWWNESDTATPAERETANKNIAKDALNIVGLYTRLPLGPLGKPLGFLMDLDAGKVQPKGAGDYARGLVMGSLPKEK